jgi:serine/threonine-protein kinase HipA
MTNNRIKELQVHTPQGLSGSLHKEARYAFNYISKIRDQEVSLALPTRAESYSSGNLFSVFQMNRPEGYLLEYIQNRFSKSLYLDDMMLLKLTGNNQIGRLTYSDTNEEPSSSPKSQVSVDEIIKSTTSEELFEFLVDTYFSSGISGFQPKVIVPVTDKRTIPTTEYIVKSSGEDYPYLAQNEFLCMEVARISGIRVPEFWLSDDGGLFIMSRFDRKESGEKLGLEDCMVLMGKGPNEKYQGSYENIAKIIELFCKDNAVESKKRFFEYFALSVLLQNGDAHLKNFSLMYDVPGGNIELSPLYDVVTTSIYTTTNPKTGYTKVDNTLALNLNKSKSYPTDTDLIKFGESFCMVSNAQQILEKIEDAKRTVLHLHASRMNSDLIQKIKKAWRVI